MVASRWLVLRVASVVGVMLPVGRVGRDGRTTGRLWALYVASIMVKLLVGKSNKIILSSTTVFQTNIVHIFEND